jgi:aspartate/methionine/tyrosine aminotransferase
VLVIPGTAFMPTDERWIRFSYANLDEHELDELGTRLAEMR